MRKLVISLALSLTMFLPALAEVQYLSFAKGISAETAEFKVAKTVTETLSYIDVTYTFEGATLSTSAMGVNLGMDNAYYLSEKGNPSLPFYSDMFVIPNLTISEIEVLDVAYQDFEGVDIAPSVGNTSVSSSDDAKPFERSDVYQNNAFFPNSTVSIVEKKIYQGAPLVNVNIYPVCFNPVKQTVRCYSTITYRLHIDGNDMTTIKSSTLDKVKLLVSNASFVSRYNAPLPNDRPGRPLRYSDPDKYLFITVPDLEKVTRDFAAWKTMMGYECVIMTNKHWTMQSVRDSITQFSKNIGDIKYLLIVGDSLLVPCQTKAMKGLGKDIIIPTDKMYACLSDTINYITDFSIGRIPCNQEAVVSGVFDKIRKYESTPPLSSDFYRRGLHCAYFQDTYEDDSIADGQETEGYSFVQTSEQIRDINLVLGKSEIDRVYAREEVAAKPYLLNNGNPIPDELKNDGMWLGNASSITESIEKGVSYIVYSGHGGSKGWWEPNFTDLSAMLLENGDLLPVIFSSACHVGNFTDKTCLATAFLRNRFGGAVGMTANTHVGWSKNMDRYLLNINALMMMPGLNYSVADMMELSMVNQISTYESDYEIHTRLAHHYFGDPSMRMYAFEPDCIHPTISQKGDTVFVSTNVDNCQITLVNREDPMDMSKFKTFANQKSVRFESIDYPYTVCVTKAGYVPFISLTDKYLQNITYTSDKTQINGNSVYVGNHVTSTLAQGNVVCRSGYTEIIATNKIILSDGFRVERGAEFKAIPLAVNSCNYKSNSYDVFDNLYNYRNDVPTQTEISDNEIESLAFTLYPNPSTGHFTVGFGDAVGEKQLRVYTMSGDLVYESTFYGEKAEIALNGTTAGIYVVQVVTADDAMTQQLIIK